MTTFNFLPQASSVKSLLDACVEALQKLPEKEREAMTKAMTEFETFGSPSLWSIGDVDGGGAYGLTENEKRIALSRFIRRYSVKEIDWIALDQQASEVLGERTS